MRAYLLSAALFTILVATNPAQAAGDATAGEKIYKTKCMVCHAVDANKVGPMSRGVVGRKAGTLAGFNFSSALKASGLTWDEANLDKWLAGPGDLVKGTKMVYKLPAAKDRADVIAYLKTLTAK